MENNILCSKCEKPLSSRYYLNLFYANGKEETLLNGKEPTQGNHVAVYFDVQCGVERKHGTRAAARIPIQAETMPPEVDNGKEIFTLADIRIDREGDRYLLVLPKLVVKKQY